MQHIEANGTTQALHESLQKKINGFVSERVHLANVAGLFAVLCAFFCLLVLPAGQYWNIRLPLYLLVTIWVLLRSCIALYLMPLAVAWGSLDPANLGGLHAADILTLLLATSWLLSFTLRRLTEKIAPGGPLDRESPAISRALALAIFALLLAMLLSTVVATDLLLSVKELVKWLEVLIILLLGAQYLHTRRQLWILVVMILLATISQALFGYLQAFLDLGPSSFVRDNTLRVYGTFDQPNPYAGYINMGLGIALGLTLFAADWKTRILAGGTTIMLAAAELLSQSKGGWLAIGLACVFLVTSGMPRLRPLWGMFGLLALCALALYLAGLIPDHLLIPLLKKAGLTNLSFTLPRHYNYANSERLAHWVAGIHMFMDHPLLGVGIGNYATAYPQYAPGIFKLPLGHAHNYYINMAAEAGIGGLLSLLYFLLAVFITGGRSLRRINKAWQTLKEDRARPRQGITVLMADHSKLRLRRLSNDRALALGLLAALITVCAHNFVDNLYVHSMANLFALLIVMVVRLESVTTNVCKR
ncbi:MAG: O-antigen ligase family protein [Ktedonobacteraceae bacterium]|nr:O-antigen ligase family protein [Ktedonobacteraceae bacterium]